MSVKNKPRNAAFTTSEVQRRYRELLDRARKGPVTILDHGYELLVQPRHVAEFEHRFRELMSEVARFRLTYIDHRGEPPSRWAAQTPFPWLAALPAEEVDDFAHELLAYTFDAAQRGSIDGVAGFLRGWQSTAEAYAEPPVLAEMTAPVDYGKVEEVFPPPDEVAEKV